MNPRSATRLRRTRALLALTLPLLAATVPVRAASLLPAPPPPAGGTGIPAAPTAGRSDTAVRSADAGSQPPPERIAVFRSSTGEWILRAADGTATRVTFGAPEDQPVPADYLGAGRPQIAVFRPSAREWRIRTPLDGTVTVAFGEPGDIPVAGDYAGAGRDQIAVFRPSTGQWLLRRDDGTATVVSFGISGDLPVAADYLGLGRDQIAVYRPRTGDWLLRGDDGHAIPIRWGVPGDIPVAGDYFGLGRDQIAVYRPATREWILREDRGTATVVPFGDAGVIPMPADYLGVGRDQIAVFQPASAQWLLRTDQGDTLTVAFGEPGDTAVPAAFAPAFGNWQGPYSGLDASLEMVVRTPGEWEALWRELHGDARPRLATPRLDFSKEMVIAVFDGERPSGGYDVRIEEIVSGDSEIRVLVQHQVPAPDALTIQAITRPFHLVVIRQSPLRVRFVHVGENRLGVPGADGKGETLPVATPGSPELPAWPLPPTDL